MGCLKIQKSITAPQHAKLAGISHPAATADLNALAAQGVWMLTVSF